MSKDLHSKQTPHFGYLGGDGDFIFNAPMLTSLKKEEKKDQDLLIEIESPLEQSDNIITSDKVVKKVKEYISDNRFRIKLEDIVNQEIRKLLVILNEEDYSTKTEITPELLVERLKKYETATSNLIEIVKFTGTLGTTSHRHLIGRIIGRISEQIQSKDGLVFWLALNWYPSILIFYSAGISAIAAGNYENLETLFNTRAKMTFLIQMKK